MKTEKIEKNIKIEKIIYGIWLILLGIVLVICSLERGPVLIGGTVRTLCFGLLGMPVLLCFLMLLCGAFSSDSRTDAFDYPDRQRDSIGQPQKMPDKSAVLRSRLLQFAAFAAAAVLYWIYCFRLDALISTNSTMDALVAGGLLCAAAVAATGGSTDRSKTES